MASKKQWMQYVQLMSQLKGTARKQMDDYLAKHGTGDMEAVIKYAFSLATKYGEGTSAVAAEMYDAVAKSQGAKVPAAELASTASYEDTAKAVTHAKGISDKKIPGAVETLVKQAGEDTTIKNAIRDGAEFAWIPSGDSCPFCLTLASGGWRHASKKTLKGNHADHIHAHCDCSFAIRFDGKTSVEGYDPDKLREQYENADGRTWKDKINSMRREQYELDGEKIRAQKRAAYKRKHPVRGATDTGEAIVMADGQEIPYGSRAGFTGMTRDQAVKQAQMYSLNKSRDIQSGALREESHKGKIRTTEIARAKIESPDYGRRMSLVDASKDVTNTMTSEAKKILYHRSGTVYEDLMFIDTRTGKFITRTDFDYERRVMPSKRMMKMLDEAPDYTVAALHNHPGSTLPSPSDIHVLNVRKNAYGVVACHDGTIYKYAVDKKNFNEAEYMLVFDELDKNGYTESGLEKYIRGSRAAGVLVEIL